jgi:DNA mismatch repair protein MutL
VVEARSLFFNVPARRKFLRSEPTEMAHVEQQFRLHAVANIHAAFSLIRDGETMFQLPATPNELERIEGLAGRELARRLLTVEAMEHGDISVHGYIGGPGLSRPDRKMQVVFLNGRAVENAAVHYALREGYHTALMKGQHPITFLFLEMPPGSFDINVHPAKKEVRFHEPHLVRETIVRAVSNALVRSTAITPGHDLSTRPKPLPQAFVQTTLAPAAFSTTSSEPLFHAPVVTPALPQAVAAISRPVEKPAPIDVATVPQSRPLEKEIPAKETESAPTPPRFRILGVLHRLYVLMESAEGLVLMDQHAAHERVLFEQLRSALEQEGVPSQRLLLPVTLEVPPQDFDVLQRHLEILHKLGVDAEPFGANAFKIDALPGFLKTDDPQTLLRDILDEIASASSRTSSLRLGEDMIATTVCRHAVKANDVLREPELTKLVEQLFACEMPYCCPHGRPTLIQISNAELEKKFGRRAP